MKVKVILAALAQGITGRWVDAAPAPLLLLQAAGWIAILWYGLEQSFESLRKRSLQPCYSKKSHLATIAMIAPLPFGAAVIISIEMWRFGPVTILFGFATVILLWLFTASFAQAEPVRVR